MAATAVISWGKPTIKLDSIALPTPEENSTELTVNQGDKQEAKIEGGEVEAVRYGANTSSLTFKIRKAAGRSFPLAIVNGKCEDEHIIELTPEDTTAPGFTIARGIVSVMETYTAQEGAKWEVTVDALNPAAGGNAVEWTNLVTAVR